MLYSAVCATRVQTSKLDLIRTYQTQAMTETDYRCTLAEAVSATAAAPVYFKPVKFEESGK